MIRAITFDFGKVIGFFDNHRISQRLAPYSSLSVEDLHAALVGSHLEEDYETGKVSTAEFLGLARDRGRLSCSDEVLSTVWADIFWPNNEVIALLPRLKMHYRLLLGSNTNDLHARQFRQQFRDALRHFDHLVLSYEIGARKPNAAFFHHCQRLADCPPEACLFIDDLPANVAGARACGWQGIVYTDTPELKRQLTALGIRGV